MLKIRHVTAEDHTAISVLVVHSFEQNNEHKLVQSLRDSGQTALEMVAERDGQIVGHICFSRFDAPEGWWALAPVSVSPSVQSQGIGSELIRHGLDQARQAHVSAVVVVGSPHYYKRFGFVFEGPVQLHSPYPLQYTGVFPISAEAASASVALVYPGAFAEV